MNLDGFHLAPRSDRLGFHVKAAQIEESKPIAPVSKRDWRYGGLPAGLTADRYYYSISDLAHLMDKAPNTVRDMARKHGWRYREDKHFNTKGYYLYDLLASVWTYMGTWPGNRIDPELLREAREYLALPSGTAGNGELGFHGASR